MFVVQANVFDCERRILISDEQNFSHLGLCTELSRIVLGVVLLKYVVSQIKREMYMR